jgi:hypothetical protein
MISVYGTFIQQQKSTAPKYMSHPIKVKKVFLTDEEGSCAFKFI